MNDTNKTEAGLPGLNYTVPELFYLSFGQIWCEVLSREGYEASSYSDINVYVYCQMVSH